MRKKIFLYFIVGMALSLLAAHANAGEKADKRGMELLARAESMAGDMKSDSRDKCRTLEEIANIYAEIGEEEKSKEIRLQVLELKIESIQSQKFQFADDKILALARMALKYAELGQKAKGDEILTRAYQMAENIENTARSICTLVRLSDIYRKMGQKEKATEILSQMLNMVKTMRYDYRKDPDVMRWGPGILMPSLPFLKGRQVEAYVKDYIRSGIAINYVKAGNCERALEIAKGLKDLFARTGTLEEIAFVYLDNGQYEEALNVIEGIRNKIHRGDALSHIAYKFADAEQYDYAVRSANLITDKSFAYLVLANIADRQGKAGKEDKAKKTFLEVLDIVKNMKGAGIDRADILLKVSDAYIKVGQREEAIKILHQAFQIAKRTGDDHEKLSRFEAIGKQSLRVNHYDLAFQVVEAFKDKHWKSMILSETAVTYAKNGERKKAEETLSRALQEARGIEDDSWRALTIQDTAVYYAKIGQYQKAIQIAQSIEQYIDYKNWALEKVAVKCAEDGQFELAIETAVSIDGYQRTDALEKIAYLLIEAVQYDMALQALRGMEKGHQSKDVAVKLIDKYAEAGKYDEAVEVSTVVNLYDKHSYVHGAIAVNCAKSGEYERGLEFVERIRDSYRKAVTLVRMGAVYAKGKEEIEDASTSLPQSARPDLEVTGIVGGAEPIAIVNGEMVKEGDEIDGAKVIKIDKNAITFKHNDDVFVKELRD